MTVLTKKKLQITAPKICRSTLLYPHNHTTGLAYLPHIFCNICIHLKIKTTQLRYTVLKLNMPSNVSRSGSFFTSSLASVFSTSFISTSCEVLSFDAAALDIVRVVFQTPITYSNDNVTYIPLQLFLLILIDVVHHLLMNQQLGCIQ